MSTPAPEPAEDVLMWAVFAQYGATMLCVQGFETSLASLISIADASERVGSVEPLERGLERSAKRIRHLFHRASAAELRNLLRDKVDQSLLEEISGLIDWRDFLAHNYLTARLISPSPTTQGTMPAIQPATGQVVELYELGLTFSAVTQRVSAAADAIVESIEPPSASGAPEQQEMFRRATEGFLRALVLDQPAKFEMPPGQPLRD